MLPTTDFLDLSYQYLYIEGNLYNGDNIDSYFLIYLILILKLYRLPASIIMSHANKKEGL